MQTQKFKSAFSQDEIDILLYKKTHRCICKIRIADVSIEHLKLIGILSSSLKKDDIKWVEIAVDFNVKLHPNTISYKNKFNGNLVCHIEDFEKFYLTNMENLIKVNHIFVSSGKKIDNGWTIVADLRKLRKDKYVIFKQDTINLVGDWNNIG